jgi:hypothetical protein
MDTTSIFDTVMRVSVITGLVAGLFFCATALLARATLFSRRWLLLVLAGGLLTTICYVVALHEAVNWVNSDILTHVWVDPGPLHKGLPFVGLALGALVGGALASRRAKAARHEGR